MAQRINISIPDPLHEKLQTFKDRLNVSGLCQEAIERAIKLEEMKDSASAGIDDLAARLRAEKMEYARVFWEEGFKDGTKDAQRMYYGHLFGIALHRDSVSPEELFDWHASEETKERTDFPDPLEYGDFDNFLDVYYRGWRDGVLHVWDQVKDKLEIE